MIALSGIKAASKRIASYILPTIPLRVPALDGFLGCQVYLKPENLQLTGSFKVRGVTSFLTLLSPEERSRGIVTASSGNHAKALAWMSAQIGIDSLVVMPENSNPRKLMDVRAYSQVILEGTLSSERRAKALEIAEKDGRAYMPSSHDHVVEGQGTIGLELLKEIPDLDAVVCPIGAGGLISGVATVIKSIVPQIKVIGAEPAGAARFGASRKAGCPIVLEKVETIADGTRSDSADPEKFDIIERNVNEIVSSNEEDIISAIRLVASEAKMVAEPSSVLGIAAAAFGGLRFEKRQKVCFVITGGNNDLSQLADVISKNNRPIA